MLNATLTVAGRELIDHARDTRCAGVRDALSLMGPAVVGLLLFATPTATDGQTRSAVVT